MRYHENHCWCSKSHWDDKVWDGRVMVVLEPHFHQDRTLADPDFENLLHKVDFFDAADYKRHIEIFEKTGNKTVTKRDWFMREVHRLNPQVVEWLTLNVRDRPKNNDNVKAWCVGNDSYNYQCIDFTIFFHRKTDALRFIRHFSMFKKPTLFFDYFNDVRDDMTLTDIKKILQKSKS